MRKYLTALVFVLAACAADTSPDNNGHPLDNECVYMAHGTYRFKATKLAYSHPSCPDIPVSAVTVSDDPATDTVALFTAQGVQCSTTHEDMYECTYELTLRCFDPDAGAVITLTKTSTQVDDVGDHITGLMTMEVLVYGDYASCTYNLDWNRRSLGNQFGRRD